MIDKWALFRKSSVCVGVLPEGKRKQNVLEIFNGTLEEACARAEILEKEMRKQHEREIDTRLSAEAVRSEVSGASPVVRKRRGRPRKSPHLA